VKIDAAYIAAALYADPTPERIAKAQSLAKRSGVKWEDVEALKPQQ
jgi:hypothetical protein